MTRSYDAADRAACLRLFETNVPKFFAASEANDFLDFLDRFPKSYLVIDGEDRMLACGGWLPDAAEPKVAVLCWGMVDRSHHRRGLGAQLLAARVGQIEEDGGFDAIRLATSQHSAGFFSRFGFVAEVTVADGYGPGIDLCEMRRQITAP